MKKALFLGAVAAALTMASVGSAEAAIVYNINEQVGTGSIGGTITTDGTTGTLQVTNITSWNLLVSDGINSFDLNPGNSGDQVIGSILTANTTQLLFNFGAGAGTFFLPQYLFFQSPLGANAPYACFTDSSTGACFHSSSIQLDPLAGTNSPTNPAVQLSGEQVIGVTAVPEPATWTMLILGMGGLGAAMRRRREGLLAAV
jgi:PEP-CTERM motif